MADTKMNKQNEKQNEMNKPSTEAMNREQGQSGDVRHDTVGGGNRQPEKGGTDKDRQREQGGRSENREKSAIGGGETGSKSGGFDQNKSRSEPTSR